MAHHSRWLPHTSLDNAAVPLVDTQPTKLQFEQNIHTVLPYERKTWRKRLGTANLLTLILGTVTIITIHILLAIFWKQSLDAAHGGRPSTAWQYIIATAWATKMITISTALLRVILSLQAGIFTSMMAALVLEGAGVAVTDVPSFSVMRAVQSSPHELLKKLIRSPKSWHPLLYWLTIMEIMAILATQFLSTLLIWDFGNVSIARLANSTTVASSFTLSMNGIQDYFSRPLVENWRFGEYSEPFTDGDHYHDTGHTYRAFLPLVAEQDRATLREFHGPADVLDTRVVCLSPVLSDLVLTRGYLNDFGLTGKMSPELLYPMPHNTQNTSTDQPAEINCQMVRGSRNLDDTPNQTSLCDTLNGTLLLNDPLVDPSTISDEMGGAELGRARRFFLIADFIPTDVEYFGTLGNQTNLTIGSRDGPWSIIVDPSGNNIIRVTACYVNLGSKLFNVAMRTRVDGPEPQTRYDREAVSYNTLASRRQLGVSTEPDSLQHRGLLELGPRESWYENNVTQSATSAGGPNEYSGGGFDRYYYELGHAMYLQTYGMSGGLSGSGLLLSNTSIFEKSAHVSFVALFQDSLRATKSPALALQAFLTRLCQMIYYDRLDRAPPIGQATTVFSSIVLIPARWSGFLIATILSAAHLFCLAIITIAFLRRSDKSELGNIWQAISQIVTPDTQPIFRRTSNLGDRAVKRLVNSDYPELKGLHVLQRRQDDTISIALKTQHNL